jgi:hypothetical protein
LEKELNDDIEYYKDNNAFKAEVLLFFNAWAINKAAGEKANINNSGFSQEKLDQKNKLSKIASNHSGKSYVKFINLEKVSLAEQLHTEPSDYSHKADAECARLAQVAHDFLAENINLLNPDVVTPLILQEFQNEITRFMELKGSSEVVHEVSPELTKQYNASFAPVMMRVRHLKLLVRDFETTDNGFYTRLKASTKIPPVNVHHTFVEGKVMGKLSGNPLVGAVFSLTKAKKSGTTDNNGYFLIEKVKSGKDTLTGMFNENIIYSENITIKIGKTTHVEIIVEGK